MKELTVSGFANLLLEMARELPAAEREGMHEAGVHLQEHAKAIVGQESDKWPPLAESTIAEKERLGYTGHVSATDPLLRTGELRDSIEMVSDEHRVVIGSNDQVMVYMEHGTSKMPPRPVLSRAMAEEAPAAVRIVARRMEKLLTTGR